MNNNNSSSRHRNLGGGGVRHVVDYLKRMQGENPAFFYAIQGDIEHRFNRNIFWADANAGINYCHFGDAVRLDTCYRANRFGLPFATFTGLNHHAQPVLFGCALLLNDSESDSDSFAWLLRTWLQAISASGRAPVSITTEPDRAIQMAVAQVFPQGQGTRHRFCKWSIFRETQEKLDHVFQAHPAFEMEFKKCATEAQTIDEFESLWGSLLERYCLADNEWLQYVYGARQHWVPVYLRDAFFGEFSDQGLGSGSGSWFFDGFVNASTTAQLLIKQYEKAIASWHEKELKADFDTANTTPVLKTPSPMEKQAANLYTRRIFMKFQDELVETLANPATRIDDSDTITVYRVAKFGEEHSRAHTVRFNSLEMKANCSCQKFQFSGIICRHVLSVFRAKNVLTLPSHYVLTRWTRNARSSMGTADEHAPSLPLPTNTRGSLTVRYNNLRQEAIKFVEEGAKSIHVYNVAMDALQEAANKVAAAKKQKSGAVQLSSVTNGVCQVLHAGDEEQTTLYQSADNKEKKVRELTAQLESTNRRCEVYRANLLAILRDMEEQKLKLSIKVQNAKLSLKE